jgi:hypothetical protein
MTAARQELGYFQISHEMSMNGDDIAYLPFPICKATFVHHLLTEDSLFQSLGTRHRFHTMKDFSSKFAWYVSMSGEGASPILSLGFTEGNFHDMSILSVIVYHIRRSCSVLHDLPSKKKCTFRRAQTLPKRWGLLRWVLQIAYFYVDEAE